ncbi:hypothetical protein VHEMI09203 [[Torrubiella] hemipterigena]|uniref:2EXR domain-containing protein n=1 Tax=[Torrubiella] hemipterigena TaxID=1531966 RepID=A0A0A1TPM0_9HYPO|nr:hypothetical protein VHEMI09203 [[Torrubiella] hemipterigena]
MPQLHPVATSHQNFHYFPRLPPEIRLLIWNLCLPRRINDYDPNSLISLPRRCTFLPDVDRDDEWDEWDEFNGYDDRAAGNICECDDDHQMKINSKPPVIASVCRESRNLVLQHGPIEKQGDYCVWRVPNTGRFTIWDIDLPAGDYDSDSMLPWDVDFQSMLQDWRAMFAWAAKHNTRLCIYWVFMKLRAFDCIFYGSPQAAVMAETMDLAKNMVIPVIFRTITFHISQKEAARSDLFGRLGEEACQLVDVRDRKALIRYYCLWDTIVPDEYEHKKHQCREVLFTFVLGRRGYRSAVAKLMAHWEHYFLFAAWISVMTKNPDDTALSGAFPRYAEYSLSRSFPSSRACPADDTHPWIIARKASMPVFQPKICFRFCPSLKCRMLLGRSRFQFQRLSKEETLQRSLRAKQRWRFRGRGRWRWRSWARGKWKKYRGKAPGLPYRKRLLYY